MIGQSTDLHAAASQSQARGSAGYGSRGRLGACSGLSRIGRVSAETGEPLGLSSPAGGSHGSRMTGNVRCFETRS
jgi:hypothetical protein